VISPDVEILDIDGEAWGNLVRLLHLAPPEVVDQAGGPGGGGSPAVLFLLGGRPVKGAFVGGGTFPTHDLEWSGPASLARIRRKLGAPLLLAAEEGRLAEVLATAEGRLRHADDLVAQGLMLGTALRGAVGRGFYLDPDPLHGFPIPTYDTVQRTFDALFADGRSIALFVLDGKAVHASVILQKEHGDVTRVATHDALGGIHVGSTLAATHRQLVQRLRRSFAEPALAATLDLRTWRRIERGPAGSAARALTAGDLILDPAPPWLLTLIGAGAAYGAATRGAQLLGRFIPSPVRDMAQGLGQRLSGGPFQLLGFDPADLLRRVRPLWTAIVGARQ
jgi:hypothetical protein